MIAVGFDFDHTLGLDNKIERTIALEMLDELATETGVAVDANAASHAIDATLHAYRHGKCTLEDGIAQFLTSFGGDVEGAKRGALGFRLRVTGRAPQFITALPGAHETLAALRELGVPYALLTNGWSPLQEEKAKLIGFDGPVLVSERLRALKPDRRAFVALAERFALPLEAVWYVGDDPVADIGGANACGMTSVWFDWEDRVYPQDAAPPAYTISALSELPALVQGHIKEAAKGLG